MRRVRFIRHALEGSTDSPKARAFRLERRSANPVTTKTTPITSRILNTTTSKTSGGSVGGGRGGSVGGAGGGGRGGGGPHRASRPVATATAAAEAAANPARDNQRANLTGGARFLAWPANVEPIARKTFVLMTLNVVGLAGARRVCVARPRREPRQPLFLDRVCATLRGEGAANLSRGTPRRCLRTTPRLCLAAMHYLIRMDSVNAPAENTTNMKERNVIR